MNEFIRYKRSAIIISTMIASVFLLVKCIGRENEKKPVIIKNARGEEFAGSAVCGNCHKDIYQSHIQTAHYLTSKRAEEKYVKGNFAPGKNVYMFNPYVSVAMEKRNNGFYEVEYVNGAEKASHRCDMIIGSGTKGQQYVYWNDSNLYQLPIFYFAGKNEWANSPGFSGGAAAYNRPITSRCLECHSTFVQKISPEPVEPEKYDSSRIVYGIDCEKCHGPAEKHVEFQTQNPTVKKAGFILNPATFSRQQKLDMCALCHGGRMQKTKPSFSFAAGEKLPDYFLIDTIGRDVRSIDVHGNQFGLLSASKCFTMSDMTCGTCHDPHKNERVLLDVFSQRCMTCHNNEHNNFCKMQAKLGDAIKQNCIDCHMPVQNSKTIVFLEQGADRPGAGFMRSHFIKIYPDETQRMIEQYFNKPTTKN